MPALGELLRGKNKQENPIPTLVGRFQEKVGEVLGEASDEHFWEATGVVSSNPQVTWSDSVSIRVGRGGAERDIYSLSLRDKKAHLLVLQVINGVPVVLGNGFSNQLNRQETKIAALKFGIHILSQLSKPKA